MERTRAIKFLVFRDRMCPQSRKFFGGYYLRKMPIWLAFVTLKTEKPRSKSTRAFLFLSVWIELNLNPDVLRLKEFMNSIESTFSTKARLLDATERRGWVGYQSSVDGNHSGFQRFGGADGTT